MQIIQPSKRSKKLTSVLRDLATRAKGLKSKFDSKGEKIYFFNLGDPNRFDFDTPEFLKESLINVLKERVGYYSDAQGDETLIEAVVERENNKNNLNLTKEDVIITEGTCEGIYFLFSALIEPGREDEILVPGPTYPNYTQYINLSDGKPVPYRTDEENGWKPDVDNLKEKINEKTKAIVIINPNNPTGAVYDKNILEKMIKIAAEHDLLIISDEIYDSLVFGKTKHFGVSSLSKDVPVIGFNGFSKAFLIPGWRLGYTFFHDPTNVLTELKNSILQLARQRLCACTPIMKACAVAFSKQQNHIKEMNDKLRKRADFAYKRLNKIEDIRTQKPEGAFYIFPKVDLKGRWKNDKEFSLDVLENTGIVLPHGSGFCPIYGKDHFRSVILPPIETMDEAFSKLEDFMEIKRKN